MTKPSDEKVKDFAVFWQIADRMIDRASKAQLSEAARILALQSAAYARAFGELPMEDHLQYLKAAEREFEAAKLLETPEGERLLKLMLDGMAALTTVLGNIMTKQSGADVDKRTQ